MESAKRDSFASAVDLRTRPWDAIIDMDHQNYNPTGNVFLSTVVAAIPILSTALLHTQRKVS